MEILDYEGGICKPAQELGVFLVPAVNGCSHNKCTYCCFYKHQTFGMIPLHEIEGELIRAKNCGAVVKRAMLVGGDPLALPVKDLLDINDLIRSYFPECGVITMEASIQNLRHKTDEELITLRDAGYNDLYIGIESGMDSILRHVKKGHTVAQAEEQLLRLNRLGIRHGANLIFGIGGKGMGVENAKRTAEFLNKTKPFAIVIMALFVPSYVELYQEIQSGQFVPADLDEMLLEEKTLLDNLEIENVKYDGSIYEPPVRISGIIPKDLPRMYKKLDMAMEKYGGEIRDAV